MHSDNFKKLNEITGSYFIKADTLFRTIDFQNQAIIYAISSKSTELQNAYNKLEEIIKSNSAIISEKGIRHDVVMKHMPSLCFSSLVSAFEDYLVEITTLMLKSSPDALDNVKCEYHVFKNLKDNELIDYLVNAKIASLTFGTANEYINKVCKFVGIKKKDLDVPIKKYIEIKARRDTGVHNKWLKDSRYTIRLEDVGLPITDDMDLKPDLSYFSKSYHICGDIVKIISNNISENILKEGKVID